MTGETIDSVKDAAKSVYKGKTYYFCCASCKPEFDKNPQAHVK
ncbi:MAG: YHS domain-containing protein [Armatimonadota bacterium]|nr:YHS domain-containing protein [Armatimonadota bacterium]